MKKKIESYCEVRTVNAYYSKCRMYGNGKCKTIVYRSDKGKGCVEHRDVVKIEDIVSVRRYR